ncbi:chromatin organization modifier domain-containing protein [Tritrichomonas foetus]|uniref:Chromatin organization modifier domain-containing protein n=1 Tax=Tritrichomonas foetus TaxID=1144522 RepID=A0A1J4KP24_9EUKA|nr:chromatin organization modifier domain-containing protein [Tritrichomonas foetus]|eukprot:OHT11454.1 chromatin organization modifier domain-containing protein [Tritrichomonas foetus]
MSIDDFISSGSYESEVSSDEPVFTPEKVIGFRTEKGIKEYLIKWKGYPKSDATWEKESDLSCASLIKEYKLREKKKLNQKKSEKTSKKKEEKAESQKLSSSHGSEPVSIVDSFMKLHKGNYKIYYKVLMKNRAEKIYTSSKVYKEIPQLGIEYLIQTRLPPGETYYNSKIIRFSH